MSVGIMKHGVAPTLQQAMVVSLISVLACSPYARVVRLDTGEGELITMPPRAGMGGPVELGVTEFKQTLAAVAGELQLPPKPHLAARRLFEIDARSGSYWYEAKSRRLIPANEGMMAAEVPGEDAALTEDYLRWCGRTHRVGDCLGLLMETPVVMGDGRYALAMAIAQGAVLGEMKQACQAMANPEAVVSAALWTMTMFMLLWVVPEPISKGVAAALTVALIGWLGVDTVWNLIDGWRRMVAEVDRAATFSQVREAGQRYGKVMGQGAARAMVMLMTVAIGNTVAGLAAKLPQLPGFAAAAVQAGAQGQIRLAAAAGVTSVAVSAEGLTIALAPGAVAMAARETPGSGRDDEHHIATDKNEKSTLRGGPWTPKFKKIFARAGMELKDLENRVPLRGHKGPHPERYHELIERRLDQATNDCRSREECRRALTNALDKLAEEITTPGTELNLLLTKGSY